MLNYLVGKINYVNTKFLILESNWIGYYINIVANDYFEVNQTKKIYVSEIWKINNKNFIIKELYGFSDLEMKILFNSLQNVVGIGPKTAINILKNGAKILIPLIKTNNIDELARLPGLNTHLAKAICNTLINSYLYSDKKLQKVSNEVAEDQYSIGDLSEALLVLGYHKEQVQNAINILQTNSKSEQMDISNAVATCIQIITEKNQAFTEQNTISN